HLDAVEPASLKPDIKHHEMRTALCDRGQGSIGVGCNACLVTFIGEDPRHQFANVDFVVYDEDVRRDLQPVLVHASTPALPFPVAAAGTPSAPSPLHVPLKHLPRHRRATTRRRGPPESSARSLAPTPCPSRAL